jgi:hypothetical protein
MRDTIEMAREVESEVGFMWCVNFIELARFAELVRADEREACADLIEVYPEWLGDNAKRDIAAAIRARGEL